MKFVSFSFRGVEQSGIVMGIATIDKFQSEAKGVYKGLSRFFFSFSLVSLNHRQLKHYCDVNKH